MNFKNFSIKKSVGRSISDCPTIFSAAPVATAPCCPLLFFEDILALTGPPDLKTLRLQPPETCADRHCYPLRAPCLNQILCSLQNHSRMSPQSWYFPHETGAPTTVLPYRLKMLLFSARQTVCPTGYDPFWTKYLRSPPGSHHTKYIPLKGRQVLPPLSQYQ